MNSRRQHVAECFADATMRLDAVLNPWGFTLQLGAIESSHCGPYATGTYVREATRMCLSCRVTIDNLYYQHTFVTQRASYTEFEQFSIGHSTLMHALGHADDCRLVAGLDYPDEIMARDGGDRVAALMFDLETFAFRVLREPCEAFFEIVRNGCRCYSIV
jgi:hypothetical protein